MKRISLTICCFLCLLCFLGCEPKKTVASVKLGSDDFSTSYGIDTPLNLSSLSMTVTYTDGTTETVAPTMEMIEGFDTATTGQKTLWATYGGVKSGEIAYVVYNRDDPSKEILSKTRVSVVKSTREDAVRYEFFLTNVDLGVRGVTFRLLGEESFSDSLTEIDGEPEGGMDEYFWRKTGAREVTVLVYSLNAPASGRFFTLTWQSAAAKDFTVNDIVVSDGKNDYYLPKVQINEEG